VLYVEDDNGIRTNIEEILIHLFKNTVTAKNTTEAYSLYQEHKPDLIITDIKMPGENGIEFIKKIRKTDSKVRVIITSAHTDLEYMLEVVQLHLIKYIIKPITEEKLMEALSSFVKSYSKHTVYNLAENIFLTTVNQHLQMDKKSFNSRKKRIVF